MVGLENVAGTFTKGFSQASSVAVYIFYGVVFGLVIWGVMYLLSFNVKVGIWQRSQGETLFVKWTKGRFKKDKQNPQTYLFYIMKDDRWDQPFPKNYVIRESRGFGRLGLMVNFIEDSNGKLQPMNPPTAGVAMPWSGWSGNAMEFTTRKVREYAERFRKGDFMTKYGALIQIGAFIIMFVLILVLFRKLEGVVEGLNAVAAALQTASQNFAAGSPQVIT